MGNGLLQPFAHCRACVAGRVSDGAMQNALVSLTCLHFGKTQASMDSLSTYDTFFVEIAKTYQQFSLLCRSR